MINVFAVQEHYWKPAINELATLEQFLHEQAADLQCDKRSKLARHAKMLYKIDCKGVLNHQLAVYGALQRIFPTFLREKMMYLACYPKHHKALLKKTDVQHNGKYQLLAANDYWCIPRTFIMCIKQTSLYTGQSPMEAILIPTDWTIAVRGHRRPWTTTELKVPYQFLILINCSYFKWKRVGPPPKLKAAKVVTISLGS